MSDPIEERLGALEALYHAHGDKLRFLCVGAINTAFGYGLFLALVSLTPTAIDAVAAQGLGTPRWLSDNYFLASQWAAWILSVPFGAWTLGAFVFRRTGAFLPAMLRAYAVYLPGTLVNSVALWVAVRVLGMSPQVGQLLALTIAVVLSYLGHKHFTFRAPRAEAP